jgi:hypothetical protein
MKQNIIRFEPGDGTSYRVLFHRLNQDEADAVGGVSAGAALFGFGAGDMRPMRVSVFQPDGFLHLGYYQGRMGEDQPWTLRAGYAALCHLTGREGQPEETDHIVTEWDSKPYRWRDQLDPLTEGVPA